MISSKFFKCRICTIITFYLFIIFFIIEILILIPSYYNYKQDQFEHVAQNNKVLLQTLLSFTDKKGWHMNWQALTESLKEKSDIIGLVITDKENHSLFTYGFDLDLLSPGETLIQQRAGEDNTYFEIIYTTVSEEYNVLAKIDTTPISYRLQNYVWRIVGLIFLIAFFLTLGSIIILQWIILGPLMHFKRQLKRATIDPDHISQYCLSHSRKDEMGEVFTEYNLLLCRTQSALDTVRRQQHEMSYLNENAIKFDVKTPDRIELDQNSFPELNPNPVLQVDKSGQVLYSNEAGKGLFLLGSQDTMPEHLIEIVNFVITSKQNKETEFTYQDKTFSLLLTPIQDQHTVNIYGFDITDKINYQSRLEKLLHYDTDTGLPNRLYLREQIEHLLLDCAQQKKDLAYFVLEVADFEELSHIYCPELIYQCYKTTFNTLQTTVPNHILFGRISPSQFGLVLTKVSSIDEVMQFSQIILQQFRSPFTWNNQSLLISVNIGAALASNASYEVECLLQHGELALLRSKGQFPNHVEVYERTISRSFDERRELLVSLNNAVANEELFLLYQPQVDLLTGKTTSIEVLVRWQHPKRGVVPPDKFIPLAEETGLIIPIGDWILHKACQQMKMWIDSGLALELISVNLSAMQFKEPDLFEKVDKTLAEVQLPAKYLVLEITESSVIGDLNEAREKMNFLRSKGLSLSMDDFGTGYSSLSYLKELPVNELKIDRSFIMDCTENVEDNKIVEAIIRIAQAVNLEIVAEGIETQQQADFLRQLGCHKVQGYFFAKPLSAEDLTERCLAEIRSGEEYS